MARTIALNVHLLDLRTFPEGTRRRSSRLLLRTVLAEVLDLDPALAGW